MNASSSKVNQLPVELLSYIFVLGADTGYEEHSSDSERELDLRISPCMTFSSRVRESIMSVCKRWRQIALSTPRLWTKVCVTVDDSRKATQYKAKSVRGDFVFEGVEWDLSRSRCCPLDILIDARDPEWNFMEFE